MAGNQEIKVNEEKFEAAISQLKTSLEALEGTKNELLEANQSLSADWEGEGGDSFRIASKNLEEEFEARINNLKQEIYDLNNTKQIAVAKDINLGAAIGTAIGGMAGAVSGGSSAIASAGEQISSGINSVME